MKCFLEITLPSSEKTDAGRSCTMEFTERKQAEGTKFRRHHRVGNQVLHFCCPSEKPAIEMDGGHHFTREGFAYDEKRAN